ncbi:MAG: MotA/TolQ/ExbB proton channel family protein [Spirochaetae bacterium HGW-Spirochaetae-7]|nr:MAG: MotA/TolQ/ExbB proton channel family protein [Spirochaetae bacterium HGW-Spirochaetae-7]
MLDFIDKGGVVLWVIMALSVVGLAIIIERFLYFRSIKTDEDKLFQRVKASVEKGHFEEALSICDNNESPLSALIRVGLEYRSYPEAAQKEVLKDAAAQEVPRLEKNVSALGTIAHIAPLLGLLGTVTGTMKAFGVLGRFGAVADPSILAKGVSEALITTVAGIVVAVPAVIFYNSLVTKVNMILLKMENQVTALVLMINSGKRRSLASAATAIKDEPGNGAGA